MEDLVQATLAFVAAHAVWAGAIMFAAAFGESFVFLSLLIPGTSFLVAAGALAATGTLSPLPLVVGAVLGAVLGDAVSFWIGRRFGRPLTKIWPFARNPELLSRGIRFFAKWGGPSVFIGRFFGPLRAVIPLAAGIMQMPPAGFWIANVTSAVVWAPLLLFVGHGLGRLGERLFGPDTFVLLVFAAMVLIGVGGAAWAAVRWRRPRP